MKTFGWKVRMEITPELSATRKRPLLRNERTERVLQILIAYSAYESRFRYVHEVYIILRVLVVNPRTST